MHIIGAEGSAPHFPAFLIYFFSYFFIQETGLSSDNNEWQFQQGQIKYPKRQKEKKQIQPERKHNSEKLNSRRTSSANFLTCHSE